MVRPLKYANAEERLAARRRQNCRNVKAWRNRKKVAKGASQKESDSSSDDAVQSSISPSKRQAILPQAQAPTTQSPHQTFTPSTDGEENWHELIDMQSGVLDISSVSNRPRIDLLFGFEEAAFNTFTCSYQNWSDLRLLKTKLKSKDKLMEMSVMASASHYLARVKGDPNMLRLSYEMYHRALQGLQRRLKDGRGGKEEGVLMGIANNSVLTVEVMDAAAAGTPRKREWKAGLRAGARMANRAGPYTFNNKLGLSVLRSIRSKYQIFALGDGEPILFNSDEWRIVPYETEGKTRLDELFDIIDQQIELLWKVRGFLNTFDESQPISEDMDEALGIWHALTHIRHLFKDWLLDTEMEHHGVLYTVKPAGTFWTIDSTVVPTTFDFVDKAVATSLQIYWFYELILLQSTLKIQSILLMSPSTHLPADATLITPADLDHPALCIAQSAEYAIFHLENLATALTWFIFVGLRFAILHFADHALSSPKHARMLGWCINAAAHARSKHFLGTKGQFVVDSVWGSMEEVLPGLGSLTLDIFSPSVSPAPSSSQPLTSPPSNFDTPFFSSLQPPEAYPRPTQSSQPSNAQNHLGIVKTDMTLPSTFQSAILSMTNGAATSQQLDLFGPIDTLDDFNAATTSFDLGTTAPPDLDLNPGVALSDLDLQDLGDEKWGDWNGCAYRMPVPEMPVQVSTVHALEGWNTGCIGIEPLLAGNAGWSGIPEWTANAREQTNSLRASSMHVPSLSSSAGGSAAESLSPESFGGGYAGEEKVVEVADGEGEAERNQWPKSLQRQAGLEMKTGRTTCLDGMLPESILCMFGEA